MCRYRQLKFEFDKAVVQSLQKSEENKSIQLEKPAKN